MKKICIVAGIAFSVSCLAGLIEVASRQSDMTISYEARKELAYQVVRHPSGVVCLCDAAHLKAQEAVLVLHIAEMQAELAQVRAQMKSLDDKQTEITESK